MKVAVVIIYTAFFPSIEQINFSNEITRNELLREQERTMIKL